MERQIYMINEQIKMMSEIGLNPPIEYVAKTMLIFN